MVLFHIETTAFIYMEAGYYTILNLFFFFFFLLLIGTHGKVFFALESCHFSL